MYTRRSVIAALATLSTLHPAGAADIVRLGMLRTLSPAPFYIAQERGYFRDEGVEVTFRFFEAAQPIAAAAVSNDIDIGVTALTGGFFNLAEKGILKVIGGGLHEQKGYEGSAILVSNKAYDEGLTSVEKLGGHSFAITQFGSSFDYMIGRIAEARRFDLRTVQLRAVQQVPNMIAAVSTGQVDATIAIASQAKPLAKNGQAHIIGWVGDIVPYQITALFTTARMIQQHEPVLRRFAKAYQRGVADYRQAFLRRDAAGQPVIDAATDAAIANITTYVFTGDPQARDKILSGAGYYDEGAALDVADVKEQLRAFKARDLVKGDADPDTLIDTRFLPGAMTAGIRLVVDRVNHAWGSLRVLDQVSLNANPGEVMVLIGPSGCGKSTLLNIMGGMLTPSAGTVRTEGTIADDCLNPLTYVFQDFSLLPWRNARDNVALVLENRLPPSARAERVREVLALTGLTDFASAWPRELSGGMRQRVGIARAMAVRPACLLMDEPLSALDAQTRALLLEEFVTLIGRAGTTTIYVTHNLAEAARLGQQIVVLSRRPGRVREIFHVDRPLTERSADDADLKALEQTLWRLIREDAAVADREHVDAPP